jgi:drug/metabolite transporter (DMT)-like permease
VLTKFRGEILTLTGALFFSFNGIIAKLVLASGLSPMRLTQVRCGGAFIILSTYVFFRYREKLRTTRADLPHLAIYGVVGFFAVQALYFVAISRLHVSIALIMEFTAPIWIVIWLRYVKKKYVPPLMWIAIVMAFSGLVLIAQVWRGRTLDPIGVIAALADGIVLATFFLLGEKLAAKHQVETLMVYGFGFATLAMALILPLWSFPTEIFTQSMDLQGRFSEFSLPGWVMITWVIIMGTIIPYLLVVNGLKLLSASTSSVMGMSEPILAGVFAWIWLSEKWGAIQLLGGVVVIVGIILADKARTAAH